MFSSAQFGFDANNGFYYGLSLLSADQSRRLFDVARAYSLLPPPPPPPPPPPLFLSCSPAMLITSLGPLSARFSRIGPIVNKMVEQCCAAGHRRF
jgi:hypothetical protein